MLAVPLLVVLAPVLPRGAEVLSLSDSGVPSSSDAFLRGGGGRVVSADGRWVVFESAAAELVDDDANGVGDVFVRDRVLGSTRRVSSRPDGSSGSGHSGSGVISADGGRVAFVSRANDLVAGSNGAHYQVYVWDRATNGVQCASRRPDGSPGSGDSYYPVLSADGSRIAFYSEAPDLIVGDGNGRGDLFVCDLDVGVPRRVNLRPNGGQSPDGALPILDLSGDGSTLAFVSGDAQLTGSGVLPVPQVHVVELATGATVLASLDALGVPANDICTGVAFADTGRVVAFETRSALHADDLNDVGDVYLRDLRLGTTSCLSLDSAGFPQGGFAARLSPNARYAAFSSRAGQDFGSAQLYLHDRAERRTEWMSAVGGLPANGDCLFADLVDDGTELVFFSSASGFVESEGPGADVLSLARTAPEARLLCLGDGSDELSCPCANRSGAGEGCGNRAGVGARLERRNWSASLTLHFSQGFAGGTALLLEGEGPATRIPFHNGVFCAGSVANVIAVLRPGPGGTARWSPPAPLPGTVRDYQVYYRDLGGPCGAQGNLSNALRVVGE
ncbi:MAG: PD40 domain-containing protein [Planctomycetes bacterium]|nr:PD40 domain-containing protein [Planctomycetota bacterium]MCB9905762.1 PD40 domain-containing protein [Planctomycetota bacterium]